MSFLKYCLKFLVAAALVVQTGCNSKKAEDEATDLTGAGTPVVVSGNQPASGTTTVVSSNGGVKIVGTDDQGKSVAKVPGSFRITSVGPTQVVSGNTVVVNEKPTVSWVASDNATGYEVVFSTKSSCSQVTSKVTVGKVVTAKSGATLTEGTWYVCVKATNSAGNKYADNSGFSFVVDIPAGGSVEPVFELDDLGSYVNLGNHTALTVSGTCYQGTVKVFAENFATKTTDVVVSCTNTVFSAVVDTSSLADGAITIGATGDLIEDEALVTKTIGVSMTKDTVAPTVTGLANDASPTNNKVWTWGCSEAGCTYRYLVDTNATTSPTGAYGAGTTTAQSSGNGTYYLHIEALDGAGNTAAIAHYSTLLDTTTPVVTLNASVHIIPGNEVGYAIGGTCDEGSGTVAWVVRDANMPTANEVTGTASCDGANWSQSGINVSGLVEGAISITADLTDAAGNAGTQATDAVVKDTVAPNLTITSAPTVNSLNASSYAISGNCDETSGTVNYSIDDPANGATAAVTGTATCNGTTWSATVLNVSGLDEGTINVTADLDDAYGNSATQATATPTKNTTAPALNLTTPATVNNVNKSSYSIGGACDVNTATVVWSIDDQGNGATAAVTGNATCDGANWSVTGINVTSLDDGTLDLVADMDDLGGNPAPTENATASKDTVNPTVAITSPSYINSVNEGTYSFGGTCNEAGGTVNYSVDDQGNGATAAVTGSAGCNGTSWNVASVNLSSLDDGTLDFSADLDDAAGNSATQDTDTGTKATTLPTVGIDAPGNVTSANETSFNITGTCSAIGQTVTVTIDDTNGGTSAIAPTDTCTGGNTWSVTPNLSSLDDDTLTITADVTDVYGNPANQASTNTTKDTTAPSVPNSFVLFDPASNLANDPTPTLRFSGLAGYETIRVYDDGGCSNEVASGTASTANLSIIVTLGSDNTYNWKATAEDTYGNKSGCTSTVVTYTLDTSINNITSIDPAVSTNNDDTPTFTVNGVESGDTVKIYSNSSCLSASQLGFAVSAGTSVGVTVDPGKFTTDTTYTVYARSNDAAGNFSNCNAGVNASYTLDTTPPAAPTGVTLTDPVVQPGVDQTPTFQVDGLINGNPVKLYSDATCDTEIGSSTATGTSHSFDTSTLVSDGTYNVYAATADAVGNWSDCSTATDSYTLDISNPTLTYVHIEADGGKTLAGVTGTAFLTFTASEPLQTQTVTIHGKSATVINTSGNTYLATYSFIGADANAMPVPFTIDYTDFATNSGTQQTTTTDASFMNFNNSLFSPDINITNQVGSEATLFNLDIDDSTTGNDTDQDTEAITYTCFYDTNVDGVVASATSCSSLSGFTIGASDGVINWNPGYSHADDYEIKVIGTAGTGGNETDGQSVFTLTINNTNRDPALVNVPNQALNLADSFNFDLYDTNTSNDTDIDGETITYSCVYDTTIDAAVSSSSACSELDGVDFNSASGYFTWTVGPSTPGDYEFKITGSDGNGGTNDEIFNAVVTIDISKLPQLCMVGSNVTSYFASLSDDNEVTINGSPVPGYGSPSVFQAGETFTATTSRDDLLECTGGCYAITPTDGTAAWSTETYSGTLLSTYMGRYTGAKIVVAAWDQTAYVEVKQSVGGPALASGTVTANSTVEFTNVTFAVGALWIESNAPVSAYISTNSSSSYDRDGRIITAAGKELLAFVAGGGGTPSAISTTADGTTVSAYRNDGTNFINQPIDIADIVTVTHTSATQNAEASALAIFSDKPVVVTQHADGDGTNASPSLPKSMLSTHFVTPMDGDYVSLASFGAGEVVIIDNTGTVVSRNTMTRDPGADPLAPYAYSHNPALIATGTRYVCSQPCIGIFEPDSNDDETLMTGTLYDPMGLSSDDFDDGNPIPADFVDNQASPSCSGDNDFPNLTWTNLPWGTKYLAVLVEDESNGNYVHLNLVDVDPSPGSLGKIEGSGGSVTFPSGLEGTNGYATSGWSGVCDTSTGTHTYRFKVYAMSAAIGSAVNNMTMATFESTYATTILGSASITGTYGP